MAEELPQVGGVRWFGDPLESGAMMLTDGATRPSEILVAIARVSLAKNGIKETPEILREIYADALAREAAIRTETRARGIDPNIVKLIRAKQKKLAQRVAASLTIDLRAFVDFTQNCGELGLSHHAKHLEFVPEGRALTRDDDAALCGNVPPVDAVAKLRQFHIEREHRSVHLFANSREHWHCFFSTFRDTAGDPMSGKHHWSGGGHVHYLSYLSDRRITKEGVWRTLDNRRHALPTIHIRFREPPETREPEDTTHVVFDVINRRAAKIRL